jgi:ADP-ribose pyrophosphatase YjhB (NUDIX family)
MKNPEKTWLFITRAQPGLHKWHLDAIKQAINNEWLSKVIIWIWSSNKEHTSENPFTSEERKNLVERTSQEIMELVWSDIFLIPDFWDSKEWMNYILTNLPDFDYIISGNPWVVELMKKAWKKISTPKVNYIIRWTTLRELVARNQWWKLEDFISKDAINYLDEIWAPERLKKYFQNEMKNPGLTVDVVAFTKNGQIVLIKRKNPPYWVALPWGFVDVWETLIGAAKRETMEEISVPVNINKSDYLWYWDDPDRDPRAHNISHAFKGNIVDWDPKAADDAKSLIIVNSSEIDGLNFAFQDHKEMIAKALCMEKKD